MFRFSLQPLLDYRKRVENRLRRELALKVRSLLEERRRLGEYNREIGEYGRELAHRQKVGMNIEEMKIYLNYFERLENLSIVQSKRIMGISSEVDSKRSELLSAMKDRRTIEILREREYKRYVDRMKQMEERLIDEIVVTRYVRLSPV